MRLPPLNSLKAFEAAARHASFARAAEELFVTPGAVSQQIKQLEDAMGVKLFRREHRKIYLTEFGQALLPGISDGFDRLADAINAVENMSSNKPVTISAAPSFASKWLIPRLCRFHDLHPSIDNRIDTTPMLVDLTRGDIDLGIRYGAGNYPGLVSHHLMAQEVFPVCSPQLLEGEHPLKKPADLKHHQLLHYGLREVDTSWPDWQMWLLAAGVKDVDYRRGLTLAQSDLVSQAVLDGQGVALRGSVSVKDDLEAGRLVRPFDLSFCPEFSYYLCYAKSKLEQPNVMKFKDWLLDEVKR